MLENIGHYTVLPTVSLRQAHNRKLLHWLGGLSSGGERDSGYHDTSTMATIISTASSTPLVWIYYLAVVSIAHRPCSTHDDPQCVQCGWRPGEHLLTAWLGRNREALYASWESSSTQRTKTDSERSSRSSPSRQRRKTITQCLKWGVQPESLSCVVD